MVGVRTVEIRAGWRTLALLVALLAGLFLVHRVYPFADHKFGTLKGAWIDELPLGTKRGTLILFGGLMALGVVFLLPPLLLRIPLIRLDERGIHRYGLHLRRSIEWKYILSIDDSIDGRSKISWSAAGHNRLRIRPKFSDPDQRDLIVNWVMVDINQLLDAVHAFRPDLVSIPRSVVRERSDEAEQAAATSVPRQRHRMPAIRYDPRKWTG